MNVLGRLPESTSNQFNLNAIDWLKLLREGLLLMASLLLTYLPTLAGATYTFRGADVTPIVVLAIRLAIEVLRRFVTGNAPPVPQQKPEN